MSYMFSFESGNNESSNLVQNTCPYNVVIKTQTIIFHKGKNNKRGSLEDDNRVKVCVNVLEKITLITTNYLCTSFASFFCS